MFQKYLRNSTEKVIQAINIGTMELANFQQPIFTPEFILLGKKYIVNKNHIQCVSGKNAILSDGTKIPLSLMDKHYLKK